MDTHSCDNATQLSLAEACTFGRLDLCKDLLKGGATIETRSCGGYTPLHLAVIFNNWQCVDVLLKHGANVKTRSANGSTILHTLTYTTSDNDEDLDIAMEYLILFIQLGADVDATAVFPVYAEPKLTACCLASILGHTRIANILLTATAILKGCDICECIPVSQTENTTENTTEKAPKKRTPLTLAIITRNCIREAGIKNNRLLSKQQIGLPQILVEFINLAYLKNVYNEMKNKLFIRLT